MDEPEKTAVPTPTAEADTENTVTDTLSPENNADEDAEENVSEPEDRIAEYAEEDALQDSYTIYLAVPPIWKDTLTNDTT